MQESLRVLIRSQLAAARRGKARNLGESNQDTQARHPHEDHELAASPQTTTYEEKLGGGFTLQHNYASLVEIISQQSGTCLAQQEGGLPGSAQAAEAQPWSDAYVAR